MIARANTTVAILRGTTTNAYGDTVDVDTAVATGIQASILERNRRTYLAAEAAYRVIRTYTGRVTAGTDVRKGDRLRDEGNSQVYLVTDLNSTPGSVGGLRPDVVLELSRTI